MLSTYLYEVLFKVLHQIGVPFDTPYSEDPFQPFESYRTLMAGLVGLLAAGLVLSPRLSSRRTSYLVILLWFISWGVLLVDALVRSRPGAPTFFTQMAWYLLPTLSMAVTFALVLLGLYLVYQRLHQRIAHG